MFLGEPGGYGQPGTKEFFILPTQGKLREESKHSTFHPYISQGHCGQGAGGAQRCHSQGRKLTIKSLELETYLLYK